MKLSREDLENLYSRILTLVKTKPPEFFNLRKMRGTVGLCYWTDIELDYRRDIVPTAFHELIHYLHPEWSESFVRYAESRIINYCTPLQVAKFLKFLADKIYKAELFKETFSDGKPKKTRPKKLKQKSAKSDLD
jgi:hypothetical protein